MDSFVSGPLRPVITCGTWGLMTSLPVSFGSRALLWKLAGLVEAIIAVPVAAVFHSFHRTTFSRSKFYRNEAVIYMHVISSDDLLCSE